MGAPSLPNHMGPCVGTLWGVVSWLGALGGPWGGSPRSWDGPGGAWGSLGVGPGGPGTRAEGPREDEGGYNKHVRRTRTVCHALGCWPGDLFLFLYAFA